MGQFIHMHIAFPTDRDLCQCSDQGVRVTGSLARSLGQLESHPHIPRLGV